MIDRAMSVIYDLPVKSVNAEHTSDRRYTLALVRQKYLLEYFLVHDHREVSSTESSHSHIYALFMSIVFKMVCINYSYHGE